MMDDARIGSGIQRSSPSRREFLQASGAFGAALAIAPRLNLGPVSAPTADPDPAELELVFLALDEARAGGAAYADARISRHWFEAISTRERQITGVNYSESYGIGVRCLVGGSWGFAATRELTRDAVAAAARQATAVAAANNRLAPQVTELAPTTPVENGYWETPHTRDPFNVSVEDKADYLFRANAAALGVEGVRFVSSNIVSTKERRLLATTEGSVIEQVFIRMNPGMNITAISSDRTDFQTRGAVASPAGRGWEYLEELDFPTNAEVWAEEAVMKLSAHSVDAGTWDLVLHPSNLWLTIHENIGHPTELDRALGYEANYAGTSFLSPPSEVLNNFRLGPDFMNVQGNRTERTGLATCGWDDEGVPAFAWPIVRNGVFSNYQTTRESAAWIEEYTGMSRSQGCSYAQDWSSVSIQRMPNVSLMPNEDEDLSDEAIIAQTDHGIWIEGRGSYSIDQQRYNAQFAGQVFWEIRNGRKYRMLRDVAYVTRTPDFWSSLAALGGPQTYEIGGTFFDGKAQPVQANAVSHGCPTSLFRNIDIINTA